MGKYSISYYRGFNIGKETKLLRSFENSPVELILKTIQFGEVVREEIAPMYKNTNPLKYKSNLLSIQQVSRDYRNAHSVNENSTISFVAADIDNISEHLSDIEIQEFNEYLQSEEFLSKFPYIVFTEKTRKGFRILSAVDYSYNTFDRELSPFDVLNRDIKNLHRLLYNKELVEHLQLKFSNFPDDPFDKAMQSIDRAVVMWLDNYNINYDCQPYTYRGLDYIINEDRKKKKNFQLPESEKEEVENRYFDEESLEEFNRVVEEMYEKTRGINPEKFGLQYPYVDFGEEYAETTTGKSIAGSSTRTKYMYACFAFASCDIDIDIAFKLFMCVPGYSEDDHEEITYKDLEDNYALVEKIKIERELSGEMPPVMSGTVIHFLKYLNFPYIPKKKLNVIKTTEVDDEVRYIDKYLQEDFDFIWSSIFESEENRINLLQSPTGTGKTSVVFELIKKYHLECEESPLCVISVPYVNLVKALGDKAKDSGLNVIMISKDTTDKNFTKKFNRAIYNDLCTKGPTVVIVTYDSFLYQFINKGEDVNFLFIDELHVLAKEAGLRKKVLPKLFQSVLNKIEENAKDSNCTNFYTLAATATLQPEFPLSISNLGVPHNFIIYKVKKPTPCSLYFHEFNNTRKKGLAGAVCSLLESARNELGYMPPTIIHNNNKSENSYIKTILDAKGFLSDLTHSDFQESIYEFQKGNFDILLATDIAVAGYDLTGDKFDGKTALIIEAGDTKNEIFNPENIAQLSGRFRKAGEVKIIRIHGGKIFNEDRISKNEKYQEYINSYTDSDTPFMLGTLSNEIISSEFERKEDEELLSQQLQDHESIYSNIKKLSNTGISLYTANKVDIIDFSVKIQIPLVVNSCMDKRNKTARIDELIVILKKYASHIEVFEDEKPFNTVIESTVLSENFAKFFNEKAEEVLLDFDAMRFLAVGSNYLSNFGGFSPKTREVFKLMLEEYAANNYKNFEDLSIDFVRAVFNKALNYIEVLSNFKNGKSFVEKIVDVDKVNTPRKLLKFLEEGQNLFNSLTESGAVKKETLFLIDYSVSKEFNLGAHDVILPTDLLYSIVKEICRSFVADKIAPTVKTVFNIQANLVAALEQRFLYQLDSTEKIPFYCLLIDKIRGKTINDENTVNVRSCPDNVFLSSFYKSFSYNMLNVINTYGENLANMDKLISWKDISKTIMNTLNRAYDIIRSTFFGTDIDIIGEGNSLKMNIETLNKFFKKKWKPETGIKTIRKIVDYMGYLTPVYSKKKEDKEYDFQIFGIEDLGLDTLFSNIKYFQKFFKPVTI